MRVAVGLVTVTGLVLLWVGMLTAGQPLPLLAQEPRESVTPTVTPTPVLVPTFEAERGIEFADGRKVDAFSSEHLDRLETEAKWTPTNTVTPIVITVVVRETVQVEVTKPPVLETGTPTPTPTMPRVGGTVLPITFLQEPTATPTCAAAQLRTRTPTPTFTPHGASPTRTPIPTATPTTVPWCSAYYPDPYPWAQLLNVETAPLWRMDCTNDEAIDFADWLNCGNAFFGFSVPTEPPTATPTATLVPGCHVIAGGASVGTCTPTATPTVTPNVTNTHTPTNTPTPCPTATNTPTVTPVPDTPTPTATAIPGCEDTVTIEQANELIAMQQDVVVLLFVVATLAAGSFLALLLAFLRRS